MRALEPEPHVRGQCIDSSRRPLTGDDHQPGERKVSRSRAQIAVAPLDGRIDLTTARVTARTMATTIGEERRIAHAAEFAWAALSSYASHKHPSLKLSGLHHEALSPLDETSQSLAERIGEEVASLSLVEALHYLTSLYPAMMPQRRRSEVGAFYTPPALSERLLDLATEGGLDWGTAKVLDPAAGGGAFLVPAALRMLASAPGGEPTFVLAQLARRLSGLELDVHAAALAQATLEIVLAELIIVSGRPAPAFVRVGDTLEAAPSATFDLVIGNPPYGRVALTSDQRERFKRGLYGHANLYGVFTDIAIRWCKPGGLIAFLTPTSMLGGHYFSALRGLLAKEAPPVAIDFVHARKGVFEDVLQETLLALYQCGEKARRVQVHYLHVASETEATITRNGTVGLPKDASLPWLAPRAPEHCKLIAQVEGMPCRLSDWGYGVSTGPLVWNRFKPQLEEKAGKHRHPLIWAESVTADGRFIYRAERRNHAPYFRMVPGDAWLLIEEGCVLLQRTTAKEQPRRLIAAELPEAFVREHGGVVVENHLNMVRPQGTVSVTAAAVAAVLNSKVVDDMFRCISGSVAVSAYELEALPLPSPAAMVEVERLVRAKASRQKLETAIAALYGRSV